MSNWKTTVSSIVSVVCGFILFKPEHFPPVVNDFALYVFLGGLAAWGISTADVRRSKMPKPQDPPK